MVDAAAPAVTRDAFYGGKLMLTQPAKGHRSGTDAVLLAAAMPPGFRGAVFDIGAGVGAVGLGAAIACPETRVTLIENDPAIARLAEANVAANGLGARVEVVCADVFDLGSASKAPADLLLTNPPFREAGRSRPSPDPYRRAAHMLPEGTTLADWLAACLDLLAPKGTLIAIHAPDTLPDVLQALERRTGGITIKPIHPHALAPARRLLVRSTKGSLAPLTIAAPLMLHAGDGFTPEAAQLHAGETQIAW